MHTYDERLQEKLDFLAKKFEVPAFIEGDPISIPHQLSKKEDIEIISFFVATIAWGRRSEILKSGHRLLDIMHGNPYECIMNPSEAQLKSLNQFYYRTFQPQDVLYFHHFLQQHYHQFPSLENAFITPQDENCHKLKDPIGRYICNFHHNFLHLSHPPTRTLKHIPNPLKGSAAKRLIMLLRWMVRKNEKGVDFGIWKRFKQHELHLPIDVHVGRIARKWGLITRKQNDWKAVIELSQNLRMYDQVDPAKYDFALFGYALNEKTSQIM